MKKLAFSLITCLAFVQSTYAATSALTESLLEYEAITSTIGTNPSFQNIISPFEFIIDIERITHQTDVIGIVKYAIVTRVTSETITDVSKEEQAIETRSSESGSHGSGHHHHHKNTYIAKLNVSPNPGIGPNIVTVLSITQVHSQTNTFFDEDFPDTLN
jgi:hypothetical protein